MSSNDVTADLVRTIVANIEVEVPEWSSLTIILDPVRHPARTAKRVEAYVYLADGSASPADIDSHLLDEPLLAYMDSCYVGQEWPIRLLVQFSKTSGEYEIQAEASNRSRWMMTPRTMKTIHDELRQPERSGGGVGVAKSMQDLSRIADRESTAALIAAVQEQRVDVTVPHDNGRSWLMDTLRHKDPTARYSSTTWLLDQGARPGAPDSEGYTELHVLFGQKKHHIDDDVRIARRLIDLGANVNAVSPRGGLVFCEVLWMKHTDEELSPIYDLWFEQPVSLDFQTPAANGREPLGMARALPYRKDILERMERYVAGHP